MAIAIVFPGQGSQSVGMVSDLAETYPLVQELYQSASEVLNYDLWQRVDRGPKEELDRTECTQPAMLVAGVAVWQIAVASGSWRPQFLAGHSLGEYAALVCAGAIDFIDAVKLVAERGRLMQAAVPAGVGAMAAVLGLEDAQIVELCRAHSGAQIVSGANFNSPGQVVIAGHKEAVDQVMLAAKTLGAKRSLLLPVSVPSHCALMTPAAKQFAEYLQQVTVRAPLIPIVHNYNVKMLSSPTEIRQALVRQLDNPVLWSDSIRWQIKQGVTRFVECGPGKVLAGLIKRIDKSVAVDSLGDSSALHEFLKARQEEVADV